MCNNCRRLEMCENGQKLSEYGQFLPGLQLVSERIAVLRLGYWMFSERVILFAGS